MIKDYTQSDTFFCSVKTVSGEIFYQSKPTFLTSAEFLLSSLSEQEQFSLSVWGEETKTVTEQGGTFVVKGKNSDIYWSVQAMKSQKDFIASASHELKSPLAVLFAHVEKLKKLGIDNYELDKSLQIMDRECMRMSQLVGDMLLLASSDARLKTVSKKEIEIDIDTLLISLYEKYEIICIKHKLSLRLELSSTSYPMLYSDPELIMQVLCIFMDNAISHSHSSPSIEIQTSLTAKILYFI